MRRKLAAGNWKMHGTQEALTEVAALAAEFPEPPCDVLICPPATLISRLSEATDRTAISVGGQDCHSKDSGAHTGDISAAMLKDAGASHVILGHSERRADHGESNDFVRAKTEMAWASGLTAIVCVGETLAEREAGRTIEIVSGQLSGSVPNGASPERLVVAYEPVWAIGTGKVPTLEQIGDVHIHIRKHLTDRFGAAAASGIRLLYGGSVKATNAADIFGVRDVDGALVGGASLKAADFGPIIAALSASDG